MSANKVIEAEFISHNIVSNNKTPPIKVHLLSDTDITLICFSSIVLGATFGVSLVVLFT